MGQKFGKSVQTDSVDARSGVYKQCTPAPSSDEDLDLFWTWRPAPPPTAHIKPSPVNCESDEDLFWTWRTGQDVSCEGDEEVDLFWTWRTGQDERDQATDVVAVPADRNIDDEISGQSVSQGNQETLTSDLEILTSQDPVTLIQNPVLSDSHMHFGLDSNSDAVQNPVTSKSDKDEEIQLAQAAIESIWDEEIQQSSEEKLEDDEKPSVIIQEINSCIYEIGEMLSEGAFGTVYEGTRVQDGLKVAVKYVNTTKRLDYISIPGYPEPLPRQVALHLLACEGDYVPEIVWLLDWQEFTDHYIMVLERPSPCEDLKEFVVSNGGELEEELAKDIMWQATMAAYMCCKRGVFHRDIKLEHLLITADTLDLKLIDFGCGELLKKSSYKTFTGTRDYACPEFFKTGEYYGKPATVYSLGVLLFAMLCGKFPNCNDPYSINERIKGGLTEECCDLIEACLQEDPDKRIRLEKIFEHKWFQDKHPADGFQIPVHSGSDDVIQYPDDSGSDILILHTLNSQFEEEMKDEENPRVIIQEINHCQYEIGRKLGEGGFGDVYEGTRLQDGLKVAVKFVRKTEYVIKDYINIPGYPEPLPREVGLQMLACKGEYVPVIIQFLDWQDNPDHYVMVLERPSPCEDVKNFMKHKEGKLTENIVRVIMGQATKAAEICCKRGVLHRDIKMENLLINPDTLEVKMIDFGCGDLLKKSAYTNFMGTRHYTCPEFLETGKYHGKPATVYSLGVLLFTMLCGKFPSFHDLDQINERTWYKGGLTKECWDLVEDCLQGDPDERIDLEMIRHHKWFQIPVIQYPDDAGSDISDDVAILTFHTSVSQSKEEMEDDGNPRVIIHEINHCRYEIGRKLGEGGFGVVYEGTRVQDGLKVKLKFVKKTEEIIKDYINIPGYPEPLPREVGLQMLACEGEACVQFLDWQDRSDHYIMVQERSSPREDATEAASPKN